MKKYLLINFLFLLISIGVLNAQVRRIVLLEEATNSSCGDCATSNIKLQAFFKSHFGGVISLRYHASWPSPNDPMYAINPVENNFRINDYYGIWFVADYFMDGIDYREPLDSLVMIDEMHHQLSIDAPVKIKVSANIDSDSVRATLKLIGVSPVLQTELRFRAAVIERMIQYSSPPGSNGETIFPDVMRKLLPDTTGFVIENINPGEEITYNVSCPVNPEWHWQDLAVVAWLQTDENQQPPGFWQTVNHEIIQSNISIPTYAIQSDDPFAVFLTTDQHYSKNLKIINDNDVDIHLRLKVTQAQLPAGWDYDFTYNNNNFDSLYITINSGDSVAFVLNINTNSDPGIIRLALFAQNLDDPYNYGYTANYLGVTKTENSNVLFIDDDDGGNSEIAYFNALDSAGVCYTSIEGRLVPALENLLLAENFKAVFWNISERPHILSQLEMDFLENYLNNGGNLFIAISDPDVFSGSWLVGSPFLSFCINYFDAEKVGWFSSSSLFTGIEGTLGAGIITNLSSSTHIIVESYSGASDPIFQYAGTSNYGGLNYDVGIYKVVFLGSGLEQFTTASARQKLIQNVVNWFEAPAGVFDVQSNVPSQYNLEQNYPNPFNPSTTFKYSIPNESNVTIKVYDVLGNEVATLVNEEKPAGTYEVIWYAEGLTSGVYFYQLKVGGHIETKKMLLIK